MREPGKDITQGRNLRYPPLKEALLELRWSLTQRNSEPPVDPAYPIVAGLLYNQVKERYPAIEELPQSRLPAEILQYQITHRFRIAPNQWPLVQIGPGIASLNFTVPYSWANFQEAAGHFIGSLQQAYSGAAGGHPSKLVGVSLRYINEIAVESDFDLLRFLQERLHICIQSPLPPTENQSGTPINSINFHLTRELRRPMGLAIVAVTADGAQERIILDLRVLSSAERSPSFSEILEWLSDAHQVIEDWFFTFIAGHLHEKYNQEGQE